MMASMSMVASMPKTASISEAEDVLSEILQMVLG